MSLSRFLTDCKPPIDYHESTNAFIISSHQATTIRPGVSVSIKTLKQLFYEVDASNRGYITFKQFIKTVGFKQVLCAVSASDTVESGSVRFASLCLGACIYTDTILAIQYTKPCRQLQQLRNAFSEHARNFPLLSSRRSTSSRSRQPGPPPHRYAHLWCHGQKGGIHTYHAGLHSVI